MAQSPREKQLVSGSIGGQNQHAGWLLRSIAHLSAPMTFEVNSAPRSGAMVTGVRWAILNSSSIASHVVMFVIAVSPPSLQISIFDLAARLPGDGNVACPTETGRSADDQPRRSHVCCWVSAMQRGANLTDCNRCIADRGKLRWKPALCQAVVHMPPTETVSKVYCDFSLSCCPTHRQAY